MKRTEIVQLLKPEFYQAHLEQTVLLMGWVKAFRANRFIALNDGSTINNVQVVVDFENFDEEIIKKISFHSCIKVSGKLIESQGAGQSIEIQAEDIEILGESNPADYPIQPKRMTM